MNNTKSYILRDCMINKYNVRTGDLLKVLWENALRKGKYVRPAYACDKTGSHIVVATEDAECGSKILCVDTIFIDN
jgi:hypothetical protein